MRGSGGEGGVQGGEGGVQEEEGGVQGLLTHLVDDHRAVLQIKREAVFDLRIEDVVVGAEDNLRIVPQLPDTGATP
eukprot:1177560-Prorocentrum_minimum.AAC.1